MKRIAFLIPEFPGQTHIAWWRVSRAMASAGNRVDLVSTRSPAGSVPHPLLQAERANTAYLWPPRISDCDSLLWRSVRTRGVKSYLSQMTACSRSRRIALWIAAVRLLRLTGQWGSQHLFVHSCGDAAHVAALCRIMGGPQYSLRLGGDLAVYGGDHRLKMSRAALIVPAAESLVEQVINECDVSPERLLWTWVGTDIDQFCPRIGERKDGPWRIITVARLNRAKGFQYMLPAIARLVVKGISLRYTIVGEGPFRSEIEKQVQELGLGNYVVMHGASSAEDIVRLHRESDLFVLPTSGVGEGTPAAVCEAMSCGLPIVATRVGGLESMIEAGRHGLVVDPANSEALADAIEELLSESTALSKMGQACRDTAVEKFDVTSVAKAILCKIDSLGGYGP